MPRGVVEAELDEPCRRALVLDAALFEAQDLVAAAQRGEVVRDEDDDLAEVAEAQHQVLEEVRRHVRVHRRQNVIQQIHVGVGVEGSRESDALLLAARNVEPLFADLGVVAVFEFPEVLAQRRAVHGVVVLFAVERRAEQDVLPHARVPDPRRLRAVRDRARDPQTPGDDRRLSQEREQQARFAGAGLAHDRHQRARRQVQRQASQQRARFRSRATARRRRSLLVVFQQRTRQFVRGGGLLAVGRRLRLAVFVLVVVVVERSAPVGRDRSAAVMT
mmetsp:Transcript_12047/g.36285  ORF Transcript_12047/g.36285 Transcript_12047/m.36285 type:complete len:275 (-) Transcript_12047:1276-2100(-)